MTSARLPQNPADHTGLRGGTRTSLLVGAVALAVRLTIVLAIPVRDVGDMAGWMEAARRVSLEGIGAAYEALDPASLYPPGFMYPLWVTGQVYLRCCSPEFELQTRSLGVLMRLAPILADSGLAVLVGQLAALAWGPGRRLPAGLLYALNPAVLVTVAWEGMIGDPYYAALVVAGLLAALRARPVPAAVCLALGVMVKPQALAFVPLVGALIVTAGTARRVLLSAVVSLLVAGSILAPFALSGRLSQVGAAARQMASLHAYTQNSADNLWMLVPVWRSDPIEAGAFGEIPDDRQIIPGLSHRDAGLALFGLLYLVMLRRLGADTARSRVVLGAAVIALGFFFLNTRMHVNYVFLAFPFLCALAPGGGLAPRLALAGVTLSCLVDWDLPSALPWIVHRANAALYFLSLLVLAVTALRTGLPGVRVPVPDVRRRADGGRAAVDSSPAG